MFRARARRSRITAREDHNFFYKPADIVDMLANDCELLFRHDQRYLPLRFGTSNPIIGAPVVWVMKLVDVIGRMVLPQLGGDFTLVFRKRRPDARDSILPGSL